MKNKFTFGLFRDKSGVSTAHKQPQLNELMKNLTFLQDDAVTKKQKELADLLVLNHEKYKKAINDLTRENHALRYEEKELTRPLRQSEEAKKDITLIREEILTNIRMLTFRGKTSTKFYCTDRFESRKDYLEFFSQILENYGVKFYQTSESCRVDDEQFNVDYWNIELPMHFCKTTPPVQENDIQCGEWLNKWLISFDEEINLIFQNVDQSIKEEVANSLHTQSSRM